MQILSTGGTMSAIEEQPETIVEHLNALWDNRNNRPIPTDIRWEDYAPEKVMLRFKDELKRLQPYVEGWFSERGKSLPDWPKLYFVPVEGWINYFKAHPDAARLPKGPTRDEWIASRVLYLSALCPWRYTQGIFRFAPSFTKALCSSSLKGDIPCEVFLRLPQWSIYVETPKTRYDNSILVGFWAHLQNRDITMEKPALKLLLNMVNETGGSFLSLHGVRVCWQGELHHHAEQIVDACPHLALPKQGHPHGEASQDRRLDGYATLDSGVFRIPLRPQQDRHRLVRRAPARAGRDELNDGQAQKMQQSLSAPAR